MAAGLGFKTFLSGDVLSAGDVNGYLMQGINVFATTAARDAAITSPQEGQFAFTKDTNSLWYYDSTAWVASGATGDIEGVTAGIGISGGGTSGTVTVTNSMATAIDAKGDLIAGTGADAFSRLAVGANDTVLTADSAQATGLKWAAAAGATGYTLLNAGGTALSGSSTVTISSIAAKDLFIYYTGATCGTVNTQISLRFNADTAANYTFAGWRVETNASYASTGFSQLNSGYSGGTSILLNKGSNDATQLMSGGFQMNLTDKTGWKALHASFGANTTGTGAFMGTLEGFYEASAAITSISLISSAGNFTAGTIYVLGAN